MSLLIRLPLLVQNVTQIIFCGWLLVPELEVTWMGAEPLVALHATTPRNVHIVHITAHPTILIASCVVLLVSSLGL